MRIYQVLLFGLFFYLPFLMVLDAYRSSGTIPRERTLWYQDFRNNPRFNLDMTVENFPKFKRNFFKNNQILAYFNEKGEISHKFFLDNQTQVFPQREGYVVYQKIGDLIGFHGRDGNLKWSYSSLAYPVLSPLRNNLILVSTDNTLIRMMDRNQKELIPETYLGTLITDLSFCPYNDNVVISTIESKLYYFKYDGEPVFNKKLEDSSFNYIKSVSCSYSGNYVVVLSGMEPEKLVLLNQQGDILWSKETGESRYGKTTLHIDEENQMIYDYRKESVKVIDLKNGETMKTIPNPNRGTVKYSLFSTAKDYFLVGLNQELLQSVHLYDLEGNTIWEKNYRDLFIRYVEIQRSENLLNLLIILNNSVYAYQLSLDNIS